MLTIDNASPDGLQTRPRQILISQGHGNLPSRRHALRRQVVYVITAVAACAVMFELVAILLLRR
jgi:hypothetical protein